MFHFFFLLFTCHDSYFPCYMLQFMFIYHWPFCVCLSPHQQLGILLTSSSNNTTHTYSLLADWVPSDLGTSSSSTISFDFNGPIGGVLRYKYSELVYPFTTFCTELTRVSLSVTGFVDERYISSVSLSGTVAVLYFYPPILSPLEVSVLFLLMWPFIPDGDALCCVNLEWFC